MATAEPLVSVSDLSITYLVGRRPSVALDSVTLDIPRREILAIVGESGSGKTTLANAISAMLPDNARVDRGRVTFEGIEMLRLPERRARRLRGRRIGVIPQDPMVSLNPTRRISAQVADPLRVHRLAARAAVAPRVRALLTEVGLADVVDRVFDAYPHELSGGMRQRAMIGMTTSCKPRV